MAAPLRASPVLLLVAILSVVAGAAAGLLGVGSPASPPLSFGGNYHTVLPIYVLVLLVASPVILLGVVLILSAAGVGGEPQSVRPAIIVLGIVGTLLLVALLLIHPAAFPASAALGGLGGSGGGTGPGHGTGSGGNGTSNGSGPGSGIGGTNASKNSTTNNTTRKGGSGEGSNSSNNSTGSGGGTSPNGTANGTKRSNTTGPILVSSSPPTEPRWALFFVVAVAGAVIAALVVPRWAARPRTLPPQPPPAVVDPRAAVATALSEAATRLTEQEDPRLTIGRLYRNLLEQLEPLRSGSVHRTPEEIRRLHLLPLGIRPVAADYLTHLFEEASYSSHPVGAVDVTRARDALRMAEADLRTAHGAA